MWAVVVLNWNGRDDTLACLASLRRVRREDVAVICVDNGSTDGTPEAVRAAFPEVEVLETGANLGFAGGNNAGIARALEHGADWVVLLNNDATIAPDALEAFDRAVAAHPDAGVLAGKVLYDDPPDQVWFAGQRVFPRLGYSGRARGWKRRDRPRYDRPGPTGRAAGALMAVSRAAIETAGPMDDDAVPLRRGRRMVAADPPIRVRGVVRTGRARLAPGLGGDRRRAGVGGLPLLRDPQHRRRLRAPRAAARDSRRGCAAGSSSPRSWRTR